MIFKMKIYMVYIKMIILILIIYAHPHHMIILNMNKLIIFFQKNFHYNSFKVIYPKNPTPIYYQLNLNLSFIC